MQVDGDKSPDGQRGGQSVLAVEANQGVEFRNPWWQEALLTSCTDRDEGSRQLQNQQLRAEKLNDAKLGALIDYLETGRVPTDEARSREVLARAQLTSSR
jgi:hypothetical protein